MTTRLNRLLDASEGRYPTPNERQELREWAAALPARLAQVAELEKAEEAALEQTLAMLKERHPAFAEYAEQIWPTAGRDLASVTRAAGQALLADDADRPRERLLYWLRSLLAGANLTPGFVRDAGRLLTENVCDRLAPEAAAALRPYFDLATEVLCDFPEPAEPAV